MAENSVLDRAFDFLKFGGTIYKEIDADKNERDLTLARLESAPLSERPERTIDETSANVQAESGIGAINLTGNSNLNTALLIGGGILAALVVVSVLRK